MQCVSILVLLGFVCSCALAFDVSLNHQWSLWKQNNNKQYSNVEENTRRAIWENNLKIVQEHNLKADLGIHTYWLGMNQFADLTVDEFVKTIGGSNMTVRKENSDTFIFNPNNDIPDAVDWRTKGCVGVVKDQGQCGSSTIFAVEGLLEGLYCRITGKFVPLSTQQIIDCSGIGCTGSTFEQIYQYLIKAGGLEDAQSYPPSGSTGQCQFDPSKIVAKVIGYTDVASRDEKALQVAVAIIGPIAVAIDASHSSFQLYASGIYNEPRCSQTQLDQAVLVVGYGSQSNNDYWIVKNSWGITWGEQGYIRMSRNKNNQCGIATDASYITA